METSVQCAEVTVMQAQTLVMPLGAFLFHLQGIPSESFLVFLSYVCLPSLFIETAEKYYNFRTKNTYWYLLLA